MSDARLRELERRWKETNSPDDEAAYLLERVRVGDLTRERLELAAYCGQEGASRALGGSAPTPSHDLVAWVGGLEQWGERAVTLAAAAIAVGVLPVYERETGDRLLRGVVEAARQYAAAPSGALAYALDVAGQGAGLGRRPQPAWTRAGRESFVCLQRALGCVWTQACGEGGFDAVSELREAAQAGQAILHAEVLRGVISAAVAAAQPTTPQS